METSAKTAMNVNDIFLAIGKKFKQLLFLCELCVDRKAYSQGQLSDVKVIWISNLECLYYTTFENLHVAPVSTIKWCAWRFCI